MDKFNASIRSLFNHRPAEHQPDTGAWLEQTNVHRLPLPPAVTQIEEALQNLRTLAMRGELVEVRITAGLTSGQITQRTIACYF